MRICEVCGNRVEDEELDEDEDVLHICDQCMKDRQLS